MSCSTHSALETRALGSAIGRLLDDGAVIAVSGPLGAGKTCFVQGLAEGAGITDNVVSPTFIIHRRHVGRVPFHHVDAYRLRSGDELLDAVGPELFSEAGIVAIEWADRVASALPSERLSVDIAYADEGRTVDLRADGPRARDVLARLELPE